MLFSGTCKCRRCGRKDMYYYSDWTDDPDHNNVEIVSVSLWCQNEDCSMGRRGFGVRIEKELENG